MRIEPVMWLATRRYRRTAPSVLVLSWLAFGAAHVSAQRTVSGNTIVSDELPAATLEVDPALTYVGTRDFVLYGVADVDLHVFVEAEGRHVKRLLWVQFEGYRDDNTHTYDYSSDPAVEIDGRRWHTGSRYYPSSDLPGRPGSDGDNVVRLLEDGGYELGEHVARVRMVWLLNEPARDELMFIYMESLDDHGQTTASLDDDPESWGALAADLERRARAAFSISR